jgi:hypothetical protein
MSLNSEPVILGITFADMVIQQVGTGKYSLIGCFNQYFSNGFPFIVPPFITFVSITNVKGKFEKQISVTARFEDSKTGHVLANVTALVGTTQPDYQFAGTEVIEVPFPLPQFPVAQPGVYSIVVLMNNELIGRRNLPINPAPTGQPPTH